MVEFDPQKRIEVILNQIIPSILTKRFGKERQLAMLKDNRQRAHRLRKECGYPHEPIEEAFEKAFQSVNGEIRIQAVATVSAELERYLEVL